MESEEYMNRKQQEVEVKVSILIVTIIAMVRDE